MIYPSQDSEKAISNYCIHLIKAMKSQGLQVDSLTYEMGNPFSFFKIIKKLKKYDILHLQHEYGLFGYYGMPFFFILPFLKMAKKKILITTMHTAMSHKEKINENKVKNFLRNLIYFLQNRLINYSSDLTIVHADFFKGILVKEYGFKKSKVEILPHGIIENVKTLDKPKARKELNIKGNTYLIIGNLQPVNGSDIILKQADKIGKTIIVATNPKSVNIKSIKKAGSYINILQNIVKNNAHPKYVRFDLKEIPYELWWKYFSAADLILLPYRGGIGSGIFSDAMALKKPVVASNIPYFRWIAKEYGCVKIARKDSDFPETIKDAMKKQNYAKMESECKKYFNERGLTPVSKRYVKIYKSLI